MIYILNLIFILNSHLPIPFPLSMLQLPNALWLWNSHRPNNLEECLTPKLFLPNVPFWTLSQTINQDLVHIDS